MATSITGIATEDELKIKLDYQGIVNSNKCATKSRAIYLGANSAGLDNYIDNQLVRYSDCAKIISGYHCRLYVSFIGEKVVSGATFSVYVRCQYNLSQNTFSHTGNPGGTLYNDIFWTQNNASTNNILEVSIVAGSGNLSYTLTPDGYLKGVLSGAYPVYTLTITIN